MNGTQALNTQKHRRPALIAAALGLVVALTAGTFATAAADAALDDGGFKVRSVDSEGFEGIAGMQPSAGGDTNPGGGGTNPGGDTTPGGGDTNPGGGTTPGGGGDYTGPEPANSGQWANCWGPGNANGFENSIGVDFKGLHSLYRNQTGPLFTNFMIYRTVNGTTTSQPWSANPARDLRDQTQYTYLFHDHGSAFHNLPADNAPMQVYVRPVYAGDLLGTKSNTLTIYQNADPSRSYCRR